MNTTLKMGFLMASIGISLSAGNVQAEVAWHELYSNAVDKCQAFTPGPTNTIRNRAVGSENIGPPLAVACNFQSMNNGALGNSPPKSIGMWFGNQTNEAIFVTCTLLTGYWNDLDGYAVTKTSAPIEAGGQHVLVWDSTDNPTPGATDLGNRLIGVNCILPTGASINDVVLFWVQDNGV